MASLQILTLSVVLPHHLTRKPGAAGSSRPVEAIARNGHIDQTNRIGGDQLSAFAVTLTEVFRDFPQLYGKYKGIPYKV